MTANQVAYYNATENARHNLAMERETNRSNLAGEAIKAGTLAETNRSNLANEQIKRDTLSETSRSNRANESINAFKALETERSNKANEQIQWGKLAETNRSNLAKEAETNRSNLAKEAETNRANTAKEAHETAKLDEQKRANEAAEHISQDKTRLDAYKFYSNPDNMVALNLGVTEGAFTYNDPSLTVADEWINGTLDTRTHQGLYGAQYVTEVGGGLVSSILKGIFK